MNFDQNPVTNNIKYFIMECYNCNLSDSKTNRCTIGQKCEKCMNLIRIVYLKKDHPHYSYKYIINNTNFSLLLNIGIII